MIPRPTSFTMSGRPARVRVGPGRADRTIGKNARDELRGLGVSSIEHPPRPGRRRARNLRPDPHVRRSQAHDPPLVGRTLRVDPRVPRGDRRRRQGSWDAPPCTCSGTTWPSSNAWPSPRMPRVDGVGRRLVEACWDAARDLEIKSVFTLTYVAEFFEKNGYHRIEKSDLPHKIWNECVRCPLFPSCNEVALIRGGDEGARAYGRGRTGGCGGLGGGFTARRSR